MVVIFKSKSCQWLEIEYVFTKGNVLRYFIPNHIPVVLSIAENISGKIYWFIPRIYIILYRSDARGNI